MLQYILLLLVICLFWSLLLMDVLGITCPLYSFCDFYVCCIVESGRNLKPSMVSLDHASVTPAIVAESFLYLFVMVL